MSLIWWIRVYFKWRERKSGVEICDYDKGCGYYSLPERGAEVRMKMQSGRTGIYKFLRSEKYWDPHDMIKHAWFQCLGYEDTGRFNQMTLREFAKECAGYKHSEGRDNNPSKEGA